MKDYFLRDGVKRKKFGQKNKANAELIKSGVQKLDISIVKTKVKK